MAIAVSPEVAAPVLLHIMRALNNRTMADVARSMGVSYQSYQGMESGKKFDNAELNNIRNVNMRVLLSEYWFIVIALNFSFFSG